MNLHHSRRRPATSFTRPRKSASTIVDKYQTQQKLANSEIIRKPTSKGQRENFLKLTQILQEDKINQKSFIERDKHSNDKTEREQREIYHTFCLNFSNQKQQYHKRFEEMSKSARNRGSYLIAQSRDLEDLEREAYRAEMGLDDPPIYEDKKEPIFVNKDTNYGIYDAKFSLSLAKYKILDAPK